MGGVWSEIVFVCFTAYKPGITYINYESAHELDDSYVPDYKAS